MMTQIPPLTVSFAQYISSAGTRTYEIDGMRIVAQPGVFPPADPFSASSREASRELEDLTGKYVLDLGTGTGIQAIRAARNGARSVLATDVDEAAVGCAQKNVLRNGVCEQVRVVLSDMFANAPRRQYDVIIANLPIIDAPVPSPEYRGLCDPGFALHRELFSCAPAYSTPTTDVLLTHADLHEDSSFARLESLAASHGYAHRVARRTRHAGHEWRTYRFRRSAC